MTHHSEVVGTLARLLYDNHNSQLRAQQTLNELKQREQLLLAAIDRHTAADRAEGPLQPQHLEPPR